MASGFPGGGGGFSGGGGGSDSYFAGRSMNSSSFNPNNTATQLPYRAQQQLPQIFLDQSSSQIGHHRNHHHHQHQQQQSLASSYIGKRALSDFQGINPGLNSLLRSVKPRIYQNNCSGFSGNFANNNNHHNFSAENSFSALSSQRYGLPLLQQLRPQPINVLPQQTLQGVPFAQTRTQHNKGVAVGSGGSGGPGQESEKKMMNRLQELEKQLLDDDDEEVEGEEGQSDAVSVITNNTNSEWSETIQNLITPSSSPIENNNNNVGQNQISPSPSPSSSSSTTSSSTTTAATAKPPPSSLAICSRQVLLEAASAIYDGKMESAAEILSRLTKSNGEGNSEQRLMDYLFSGLKSRVNPAENPPPVADLYGKEHAESTQLLFELSPCFKLGFMAANLAILEAALEEGNNNNKKSVFHVVDFDLGKGGQYKNLLYALSERLNGKNPTTAGAVLVKITAVALDSVEEEKERLNAVGETLRQVAERVGLTLQFKVVNCNLTDLTRESLGCEPDEPLAVNFAFKLYRMPDESVSTENPRDKLLRRVKAMEPRIVTIVEQEMNANTAPFMTRVNEACKYYSALFESIDSTVPGEPERGKVEEGLGRKLANTIACEGRDRVERCEVWGKWRARMGMAGFNMQPLSGKVTELMKVRLESGNRPNPGFTVKEENGGACFGWMGKSLTVASAWR